jgi:hypothetical protein
MDAIEVPKQIGGEKGMRSQNIKSSVLLEFDLQ